MAARNSRKYLAFTFLGLRNFEHSEVVNNKHYSDCVVSKTKHDVTFRKCDVDALFRILNLLDWVAKPGVYDQARRDLGSKLRVSYKLILYQLTDYEIDTIGKSFQSLESEVLSVNGRDVTLLIKISEIFTVSNILQDMFNRC